MKIKNIQFQNYKRFVDQREFSFCNEAGEINDLTLIVGNNGTGKSTLLQAIVAMIAPLTRDRFKASDLDWEGFEYRFLQTGKRPLNIKATVEFGNDEIEETISFAKQLNELYKKKGEDNKIISPLPDKNKKVVLDFDYERERAYSQGEFKNYMQFRGHQFARQLTAFESETSKLFENIGNIYWYTEQRSSHSINNIGKKEDSAINSIRSFLQSTYTFHIAIEQGKRQLQTGQFDYYAELSKRFQSIFPDRRLVGSAPRFDLYEKSEAPDFFLSDGNHEYELSEMSAGERAIFPILMDFAKLNINNSIIIVDELELHLHSPLQQAFVRALPKMGNNNQFIITTHSDAVTFMFDEKQIIRLK